MDEIGKKAIIGNPEDIMSFLVVEVSDILEISSWEKAYELSTYPLLSSPRLSEKIKK